jgi:Peptidase family M28
MKNIGMRWLVLIPVLAGLVGAAQVKEDKETTGPVQATYVLAEKVQQRLDEYKGDDTKREAALLQMFRDAGCAPENLSEQPVPHRKQPNVICVLPGRESATIVVGAHFDHVSDGQGVVDNWSGASMLPSLLQSLMGAPRKHTYIFVGFTGEEDGLLGSAFYVKHLPAEQLAKIESMVNLDTMGLGPTLVWVSQSDPLLVNQLNIVAHAMKLPLAGVDVNGFGESDEESFIRKRVCVLTVHSLTSATIHILHSAEDNEKALRFSDYYDTYRLLATYLTVKDTLVPPEGHVCKATPVQD